MLTIRQISTKVTARDSRLFLLLLGLALGIAIGFNTELMFYGMLAGLLLTLWALKPIFLTYLAIFLIPMENALPAFRLPAVSISLTTVNFLTLAASSAYFVRVLFKREKIHWNPGFTFFALFVLWNFATIPQSVFKLDAVTRAVEWALFLLFFVTVANQFLNADIIKNSIVLFGLGGWVVTVTGLFIFRFQFDNRLEGLLGNPNSFANAIIACVIGVLLYPALKKRLTIGQAIYILLYVVVGVIATVQAGSRGAIIAWIVLLVGLNLFGRSLNISANTFILLLCIAVFTTVIPQTYEPVLERFAVSEVTDLGGRLSIWDIAINLIKEKPLVGYGAGSASSLVGLEYYSPFNIIGVQYKSVHNPILEIWIENGLIGLLLFGGVLAFPLFGLFRTLTGRSQVSFQQYFFPQVRIIAACFLSYLVIWLKNGGATHDKNLYIYLALAIVTALHLGWDQKAERTA